MKPNGLYRLVCDWDEFTEWQCLSCKKHYRCGHEDVFKFCPYCGVRYTKLWDKKHKRYVASNGKRHYPWLQFYYLKTISQKLACDGFYAVPIEPYQEWCLCGTLFPEEFVGRREVQGYWPKFPQTFKNTLARIRKNYKSSIIKVVIKRWDGSTKEWILNE